jgi:hypothetical protein
MPKYGDRLLLGETPVICVDIGSHGNFAQTIFVMDGKGRVSEVRKEALSKPECCLSCRGTGQDEPEPGKYHGICRQCNGTGKQGKQGKQDQQQV